METVLLFSTVADPARAAKIHAVSCPLVAAAKRSRNGKIRVCLEVAETVADLEERGYGVATCKCAKGAR